MLIVICDQDIDYIQYLKAMLYEISEDVCIFSFYNPECCLNFIKKHKVDILISDLLLNPYNGIILAQKIRQIPNTKIKIIFVSSINKFAAETYAVGAERLILKSNPKIKNIIKKYIKPYK